MTPESDLLRRIVDLLAPLEDGRAIAYGSAWEITREPGLPDLNGETWGEETLALRREAEALLQKQEVDYCSADLAAIKEAFPGGSTKP